MILYFICALLLSYTLFQLGSYVTVFAMISTGAKVIMALLLVAALLLLYRRFRRSARILKLPGSSD